MKSFSSLPEGYREIISINLQTDKKISLLVNGICIAIGVAMALVMNFYVPISTLFDFTDGFGVGFLKIGVLILSMVIYMILHELVHGAAMKLCGTKKVKYGFTGMYAFAGSDDFYAKGAYIFIALAPVILWGCVLAVINFLLPVSWFWVIYAIQIFNISGAAGDLYVTVKFLKLPADILIKDCGVGMTVYSKEGAENKMKKHLIFDFDGTLVDSMKQWGGKMLSVLNRNSIDYPDNIVEILTPLGDIGSAEYFIKEFGIKKSVPQLISEMDEYALSEYSYNIPAKETVEATLREFKSRGYSLNVLTASPHRMLDVCLKRLGLYDVFDNVWSCEDFDTTKSDVNLYHTVAGALGTTADNCILFDDNPHALATAKKSGMKIVGVYDESCNGKQDEIRSLSDFYITKFSELLDMEGI